MLGVVGAATLGPGVGIGCAPQALQHPGAGSGGTLIAAAPEAHAPAALAGGSCNALVATLAARNDLPAAAGALLRESLALHGGQVVRWRAERMPLRVWVQPYQGRLRLTGPRLAEYDAAVVHAVRDWDAATPAVRLRLGGDSAGADVRIVWVTRLPPRTGAPAYDAAARDGTASGAAPGADGRSGVERDARTGVIESALVSLSEEGPGGGMRAPADVHAMAVHELGHALGLAHPATLRSPTASVMAARVAADEVTPSDRAALRAWVGLPVGLRCAPGATEAAP